MTIAITGGGTGGHIYPAIAVAEALHRVCSEAAVLYIGAKNGMEERIAREHGLNFVGIPARKIRRLLSPDTIITAAVLGMGMLRARGLLCQTRPAVLLATGGYVAAAAALAAVTLRIPVVLHEQNAVAGRTNRLLSRWAARVCVTFQRSVGDFPAGKALVTGLPVREDFVKDVERCSAREYFGIPASAFVLLVIGGSQGAAALNTVVQDALPLLPPTVFVLHQTGRRFASEYAEPKAPNYRAEPFLNRHQIAMAYCAADLALSRSGASTLAELAVTGLPAILVPYPFAYADHQTANAREFADRGASILIPQSELTANLLADRVMTLAQSRDSLDRMSQAARSLARRDAAEVVARVVLEQCAQ